MVTNQERAKREGAIEIVPGEPAETLIPRDETDRTYHCEVYDADIRIGHEKEDPSGRTLSAGVTHTISNLRGRPLYAKALTETTAYARLFVAGAEVKSEPSRNVVIDAGTVEVGDVDVTDRAGREIGKARLQDSAGVLIDPATATKQDEMIAILQQIEENTST